MVIRRTRGLFEERLTESVIGGFLEVYWEMGFGFVETVYLPALEPSFPTQARSSDSSVRPISPKNHCVDSSYANHNTIHRGSLASTRVAPNPAATNPHTKLFGNRAYVPTPTYVPPVIYVA